MFTIETAQNHRFHMLRRRRQTQEVDGHVFFFLWTCLCSFVKIVSFVHLTWLSFGFMVEHQPTLYAQHSPLDPLGHVGKFLVRFKLRMGQKKAGRQCEHTFKAAAELLG